MAPIPALFAEDQQQTLDQIHNQFTLKKDSLVGLTETFLDEYRQGLSDYGHDMAMIPTFVTGVPNGSETGTFLALDLGGTNLRVCEVELHGDKTFTLRQQKYKVSDALKSGEARALFDYLADSVDAFLTTHSGPHNPATTTPDTIHLGLTFSFPVEQTALDSGKILTWTKGFSAKNAIGNDVVRLLQDAFDRKHLHVKCVALVNDTVGALLSRAYASGGCFLGGIFGTGTNGAYVEKVANITKLGNSPAAALGGHMVVNTEWGGFNNSRSHLPSTPFDRTLDRLSINPAKQAFEKFISGMYLGEITRLVLTGLIDAAPKPLLFGGKSTSVLNVQWGVDTSVMSDVEEAWEGAKDGRSPSPLDAPPAGAPNLKQLSEEELQPELKERLERVRGIVISKLGLHEQDVSLVDAALVRWVCSLVARRAALLSGVAVATTLIQTERAVFAAKEGVSPTVVEDKFVVGFDGSLIQFYPNFERTMRESLRVIIGQGTEEKVDIGLAKDGSGVGAALCALQAIKAANGAV